jgi:hypothetical protein
MKYKVPGNGTGTDKMADDAWLVFKRGKQFLADNSLEEKCEWEVQKDGRWFVLKGWVDSHVTRSALFGLVPEDDGAQWIIDYLRVGRPR